MANSKIILFYLSILNILTFGKSSLLLNKGQTINENVTALVSVISNTYFSNFSCVVTVYEDVDDSFIQWYRPPAETSVMKIQANRFEGDMLIKPLLHACFNNTCIGYVLFTFKSVITF